MKKKSSVEKYANMSGAELRAATAEFDQDLAVMKSRALTSEEQRWWARVRRGLGRPPRTWGKSHLAES